MKAKDFFALIDAVKEDEIRADSVMYRNAFEAILAMKEGEQLDVFRWFFTYSLYGIEPKFDEKLIKNRKNKASIEFIFSLLKKQRIGWEKSKRQQNRHNDPIGGAFVGTPTPTLSHTRDKQVSKDTSISDDIQVPDGTISKTEKEKVEKENGIDFKELVDFFNETTQGVFGTIRPLLGATRKAMLKARIAEFGKDAYYEVVRMAMESDFLKGQNDKGWRASFDWLIKPLNFEKVLSGNYANREKPTDHYKGDDTIGKVFEARGWD